ncbi:Uncharacterised protein [Vibrio cholerae]|nr:Uncharacterised protein [Vibrio cholerae]CSB16570.1 Uncharacterised protein [Vibrio cholerae]CSB97052.1 Uncharacterised protein [Vibrio cholerae]
MSILTLLEAGQLDNQITESVVEILAKQPLCDQLFKVFVSRSNNLNVDFGGVIRTHRQHGFVLQHMQ